MARFVRDERNGKMQFSHRFDILAFCKQRYILIPADDEQILGVFIHIGVFSVRNLIK